MTRRFTRRTMLKVSGIAGAAAVSGCGLGYLIGEETGLNDRIRGISQTPLLEDASAWQYDDGALTVSLSAVPDLAAIGGAVRVEDETLPARVLIVHGADDAFHAFKNECTHAQRRIDVKKGTDKLECCSISRSQFSYDGAVLTGPAKGSLTVFEVEQQGDQLVIRLA